MGMFVSLCGMLHAVGIIGLLCLAHTPQKYLITWSKLFTQFSHLILGCYPTFLWQKEWMKLCVDGSDMVYRRRLGTVSPHVSICVTELLDCFQSVVGLPQMWPFLKIRSCFWISDPSLCALQAETGCQHVMHPVSHKIDPPGTSRAAMVGLKVGSNLDFSCFLYQSKGLLHVPLGRHCQCMHVWYDDNLTAALQKWNACWACEPNWRFPLVSHVDTCRDHIPQCLKLL